MILLLFTGLVVLIIGYAWHKSQYWKRRGINGPKSKLFIGNLDDLNDQVQNPIPLKLFEWTKKYGKTYGIQRGCCNALITSDYLIAKEVFFDQFENFYERDSKPLMGNVDKSPISDPFNSRGLRWKRLRALVSLAFTTKSLKKVFPIVIECSDKMSQNLEEDLKSSSVIDFSRNIKEFTADVLLQSAFGRHENRESINYTIDGVLLTFAKLQGGIASFSWMFPFLGPFIATANQYVFFLFGKFIGQFLGQTIVDINKRKELKDKELDDYEVKDFIDLLIEAQSDDVILKSTDKYSKKDSHVEKTLTKDEILGTCISFLLGGFDTTANTICFTFYNLAKHPEIQEKIRQEIEEQCPDEDLNYDLLNKFKYLDAVMKETLRLHPTAASVTSRRCSYSTKIGNLEIEKGTDVILDVLTMHRDKNVWGQDADEYKPERWLDPNTQFINNYGFGNGPRICAGMRFAQAEHKVALINVLRKYKIHEVPETKEARKLIGILMGPQNLKVRLEKI